MKSYIMKNYTLQGDKVYADNEGSFIMPKVGDLYGRFDPKKHR